MEDRSFSPGERRTLRLAAEDANAVTEAANILRAGGLVAMPTETVYGLAANALSETSVESIFHAKQRPHWDPLIVHVSDPDMLRSVVRSISPAAQALMDAFWPGPLTLLLPKQGSLPGAVTADRDLVGVRMPAHHVALALIQACGLPLAAPSANRFGHISPTSADHVFADLDGRIDAVLDGGPCSVGVESTVFDPEAMVLYRQGGISASEIETVTKRAVLVYQPEIHSQAAPESLPSPGVGIRHYAPVARVLLVTDEGELHLQLQELEPPATGVMLPLDWERPAHFPHVFKWAAWGDSAGLARTLYTGLRALDDLGLGTIVCPLPRSSDESFAEAVRDRLTKAARSM